MLKDAGEKKEELKNKEKVLSVNLVDESQEEKHGKERRFNDSNTDIDMSTTGHLGQNKTVDEVFSKEINEMEQKAV